MSPPSSSLHTFTEMKGRAAHPTSIEGSDCTQCVSPTKITEIVVWDSNGGSPVFIRYNYEITGEELIFKAPGEMWSAPLPWTLRTCICCILPFPSIHNDTLSIKYFPGWASSLFFCHPYSLLGLPVVVFRHWHHLGVPCTLKVPGGQSVTHLVDGIMGYQLFYGCWRQCNGINCAARLLSLLHCRADANVKDTLCSSVKCQGSVSTHRESCQGSSTASYCFLGAVWSWPVYQMALDIHRRANDTAQTK